MTRSTLQKVNTWATVAYTLITFIGVLLSLGLALAALREAHEDRFIALEALREAKAERRERITPYLVFVGGGHQLPIEFVQRGLAVPGVNPDYAKMVLAFLPRDGESVDLRPYKDSAGREQFAEYGTLRNFGLGPALETLVTFVPEEVTIGQEAHKLTLDEKKDARYSVELNQVPAIPEHLGSGDAAEISRIPTFIVKDYEKRLKAVAGYLLIECKDVYGDRHRTKQDFRIGTEYDEEPPVMYVTFGDIRTYAEPSDAADSR